MIVRILPGRVRLRTPALRRASNAAALRKALLALTGVQDLQVNARVGSLLVHYDPQVLSEDALRTLLEHHFPGALVSAAPSAACGRSGAIPTLRLSADQRRALAYAMLTSLGTSLLSLLVHSKKAHVVAGLLFLGGLSVHLSDKRKFLMP